MARQGRMRRVPLRLASRDAEVIRFLKGVVLNQEFASERTHRAGPPTRWQENHGNLLLGFVAIVIVIGACILLYRQNRFVPVRFPEAEMIQTPVPTSGSEDSDSAASEVSIKVSGAISDNGSIKIAIYGSESDFERSKNAAASTSSLILDGESEWTIPSEQLPRKLAVAAYHDENNDDELNRNRLGIPIERYGFSRDARGLTGPPSYKQAVIDRPKKGETINIFIR